MITAVIATKDDPMLHATVQSLIDAGWHHRDIIVINDGGSNHRVLDGLDIPGINVHHMPVRLGPGPARHTGALMVNGGWVMFCDSHMSFPKGFYKDACNYLKASGENEVWGPVYHTDKIFDSFWHDTSLVAGADFYLWRHNLESLRFSFMDLIPRRVQHRWEYQVPCLLGGCYFVHNRWFRSIEGYKYLIGYGSEEPWLSIVTWLLGGKVSIMGELKVTHHFQTATARRKTPVPEWESNRLAVLRRVLSHDRYDEFLSWLPIQQYTKEEVDTRFHQHPRWDDVVKLDDIIKAFGLQTYDEAIGLMKSYAALDERRVSA